eukprot:7795789-Pyramimonas_sp.AAC.1
MVFQRAVLMGHTKDSGTTARHLGHRWFTARAETRQRRQKECPQGVVVGRTRTSRHTAHASSSSTRAWRTGAGMGMGMLRVR